MKILCLGAGGFIGSHLTKRLLSDGREVAGVDIHTDKISELRNESNFTFFSQDISDPKLDLNEMVAGSDLVIDLIAHANPGIYIKRPLDVFKLNFSLNLEVAETCVRHAKRLIQFSSCEVYGKTVAAIMPDRLSNPDDPALATFSEDSTDLIMGPVAKHRWIYASAKQLLERVLHAYGLEDKLDYTIVRPFNFIGPKIDYLPSQTDGFPRVFSFFMEALLTGAPMRVVDGGGQRRCYTYIDDAVDCIARIVDNPGGVCRRQIFNIGNEHNEVTILGLAHLMRRLYREMYGPGSGRLPEIVDCPSEEFYGPGYEDSDRRIPDSSKAHDLLGWEPKVGLEELLTLTMAYYVQEARQPLAS